MINKFRPRLSSDEAAALHEYREKKREHEALVEECRVKGIPVDNVNYYWYKSEKFSLNVKNDINHEQIISEIIGDLANLAPTYPKIEYKVNDDYHLLVIDPADIHISKLARAIETGDEYNHDIAFQRVKEAVIGLISRSRGYSINKVLFVMGNDILHVDNKANTTTGGTPQDVSLMWYDAFKMAQRLLIECLELLIQVAPVHVIYNPSNHDTTSGFYLAQVIEAWFSKTEDITFDISPAHRKYFRYYNNLIGTTHGDGAKEIDLPMLMAHESKDWTDCKHKYFYTHHIHHKKSRDYMSVNVESMRSPSGADSWHHRHAFQHAPKGIDAFIHHPLHGRISTLSYIF